MTSLTLCILLSTEVFGQTEQKALQMQRDPVMHFVNHNNKSDLQAHSRSLVFVPFDQPYTISY